MDPRRPPHRRSRRPSRRFARRPAIALAGVALASGCAFTFPETAWAAGRAKAASAAELDAGEHGATWDESEDEPDPPPLGTPLKHAETPDEGSASSEESAATDEESTASEEPAAAEEPTADEETAASDTEVDVPATDDAVREDVIADDATTVPAPPDATDDGAPFGFELTPPRVAYVDGDVFLLRPEEDGRVAAETNTALEPGDRLVTPADARVEIELGPRAFLRAGGHSTFELESVEPDYLRFRFVVGQFAIDARALPPGATIAIETANGEVDVEQNGYYRIDVSDRAMRITSRRGGNAILTTQQGKETHVQPSQQVAVTQGERGTQVETQAAGELDAWDRWNYRRTGRQLLAQSD